MESLEKLSENLYEIAKSLRIYVEGLAKSEPEWQRCEQYEIAQWPVWLDGNYYYYGESPNKANSRLCNAPSDKRFEGFLYEDGQKSHLYPICDRNGKLQWPIIVLIRRPIPPDKEICQPPLRKSNLGHSGAL